MPAGREQRRGDAPGQPSCHFGRRRSFNDFGFSEADRTIELRWLPTSQAQIQQAATLVQRHSRVLVGMPDGLWLAAPERFKPTATECSITLLVERKEA